MLSASWAIYVGNGSLHKMAKTSLIFLLFLFEQIVEFQVIWLGDPMMRK